MLDRNTELRELRTCLDNAKDGHGNTVFISGEAGVGKTRLVNELKDIARSQGYSILSGNSLYESLTPYMPFMEALRSGGFEYLFAEETPKVEAAYLVLNNGLLVKEVVRQETDLNPDIFSGMLTTVGSFVQDSLSMLTGTEKDGGLNTLGYENYRILIESGKDTNLAVILTGRENEFLINDMREILANVDRDYGRILEDWNGEYGELGGIENHIKPLISSGKYDGIDYSKDKPEIKRDRLFENILLGFERCTKTNPTLLCIEDLQWADPSSLALLHYVSRNTQNCNLLILGTYRPEDISTTKDGEVHHLIESMQLMSREDLFQKIELERLTEEHMDEMLSSLFKRSNFPVEFKANLYKESEGNPFFIISMIRMLIEEGSIDCKDDIWTLTKELNEVNIPSKVYDVIIRRLFRVKEKEREILDFAAVIGEEFTSDILAKTAQINKIELLKHLRNLEQSHNLIRSIKQKYKFDHAKIKEVLYQHIPNELRMEYHGIVAHNIELLSKDNLNKVIEDLAYHYYRSTNKKKALTYLTNAADKAKKEYSNEEAIRFYRQALEFESDPQSKISHLENLGDVCVFTGEYDKSTKYYEAALELVEQNNKKAEIKLKIGNNYQIKGEYDTAIGTCKDALNLVKDKTCKEKAHALKYLGKINHRLGNYDLTLNYCIESMKINEEINDMSGKAGSLGWISMAYWLKGDFDKALKYMEESLHIGEKIKDQFLIGDFNNNAAIIYDDMGKYDMAIEYGKKSVKIARKIGNQGLLSATLINLSLSLINDGKYEEALNYLEQGHKICNKIDNKTFNIWYYIGKSEICLHKGDLTNALELSNKAIDLSTDIGMNRLIAYSKRTLGMIYRDQKQWDISLDSFNESINMFQKMDMKKDLADSYFELGIMWKDKGDPDKAKQSLNTALDLFNDVKIEKFIEKVKRELQDFKG
jgi:predicted ATPase